jgi:putative ABC transport system ATP-binding protein
MALIETRGVCKYFKQHTSSEVRAVDDVSLAIEPGQLVLLTGPSGSGKTTLLALMGALHRSTRGTVLFEGRDLAACSDGELARIRRRMGFVFQNFSLLSGLPVWENITYPLIPRGVNRSRRRELAGELLSTLGMAEKFDARASELSGGEQQRVAVARALAGQPAVLLADEPTSNLDAAAAETLTALFQRIHQQGTSIILSSHDPRMAVLAGSVYRLEAGRLKSG